MRLPTSHLLVVWPPPIIFVPNDDTRKERKDQQERKDHFGRLQHTRADSTSVRLTTPQRKPNLADLKVKSSSQLTHRTC